MSTIDLNVIAQNLAELLTSVTDQASKNFTLFWDTEPQDVTLKVYNSSNELVEVTVPNLAKARAMGKTGNGSPEGVVVAAPGSIYLDQQYNEVYFKVTGNGDTGWTLALTQASIESLLANYVPRTRTINNKSLRNDITLTSSDIGAIPNTEKLGKSLEVSGINLILKDQDGSNLSSVPIVTTGANKDLSNLTTTGNAKILPTQTGNSGKFLTTNGTTASWSNTVVTTSGNQTVAGVKTFTGNPVFQGNSWSNQITAKRTDTNGAYVKFENSSGTLGALGINANSFPTYLDSSNTTNNIIVRGGSMSSPAVGSASQPVFINSSGVATACTNSIPTRDMTIEWFMPDWSRKVNRGTDYTLTEDCWVYMEGVVGWSNTSSSSKAGGVCMSGGLGRGDSTMTCGGIWIGKNGDHITGSFTIYTVPFIGRNS